MQRKARVFSGAMATSRPIGTRGGSSDQNPGERIYRKSLLEPSVNATASPTGPTGREPENKFPSREVSRKCMGSL